MFHTLISISFKVIPITSSGVYICKETFIKNCLFGSVSHKVMSYGEPLTRPGDFKKLHYFQYNYPLFFKVCLICSLYGRI